MAVVPYPPRCVTRRGFFNQSLVHQGLGGAEVPARYLDDRHNLDSSSHILNDSAYAMAFPSVPKNVGNTLSRSFGTLEAPAPGGLSPPSYISLQDPPLPGPGSGGDAFYPVPGHNLRSRPLEGCNCFACLNPVTKLEGGRWKWYLCHVPGCDGSNGKSYSRKPYGCATEGCHHVAKRWGDLRRHHAVKHCLNPRRYPCTAPGCKYSGNNGFTRPDKLKSHWTNMHKGKATLGQAMRVLKPAATNGNASGSGVPATREQED